MPPNSGAASRPQPATLPLWFPSMRASRGSDIGDKLLQVFVPHQAAFPELSDDFAAFKSVVQSLSRTDTVLWCARLNILLTDSTRDQFTLQEECLRAFLGPAEIGRVNAFAMEHGGADRVRFFFRGQLLELLRWCVLLSSDHPDDGVTFNAADTRRRFCSAALMASDIWARRIIRDRLDGDMSVGELRESALPAIRRMNMENAPTPDPLLYVARGASLFLDRLRARAPEMEDLFRGAAGLGADDYFSMLALVAVEGLMKTADGLRDPAKSGLLNATAYEGIEGPAGAIARTFFAEESQGADELRRSLWGERTDAEEVDAGSFDLRILRERPLFRAADGRTVVLDVRFFTELGSAGPLFHLARQDKGNANQWFGRFGDVFEEYAQDILRRIYPEATGLVRCLYANPVGRDERNQNVELCDAMVFGVGTVAILEMKAAWMLDSAVAPETDGASYLTQLRERYGVSTTGREGDRLVKGLGQLARTIKNLCDGTWTALEPSVVGMKRIVPVLLVHDVHVDAPLHSHILAKEFANYMGVDPSASGWAEIPRGAFVVAHLVVLTIDDLEFLETPSKHVALMDCFDRYAAACPDRVLSLHNYLAISDDGKDLRQSAELADRCLRLLEQCKTRVFAERSKDASRA